MMSTPTTQLLPSAVTGREGKGVWSSHRMGVVNGWEGRGQWVGWAWIREGMGVVRGWRESGESTWGGKEAQCVEDREWGGLRRHSL